MLGSRAAIVLRACFFAMTQAPLRLSPSETLHVMSMHKRHSSKTSRITLLVALQSLLALGSTSLLKRLGVLVIIFFLQCLDPTFRLLFCFGFGFALGSGSRVQTVVQLELSENVPESAICETEHIHME